MVLIVPHSLGARPQLLPEPLPAAAVLAVHGCCSSKSANAVANERTKAAHISHESLTHPMVFSSSSSCRGCRSWPPVRTSAIH